MSIETARKQISVALCEDQLLLAQALQSLLDADEELRVVADPVDNAEDIIEVCRQHRPDVVLMDVQLRGPVTGLRAARDIKRVSPATKVVIVSGSGTKEELLIGALEAGACGVVEKTEAVDRVIEVAKAAAKGEILIDASVLPRILQLAADRRDVDQEVGLRLALLTPREREILQLTAQGLGNGDVARRLHLSVRTVETHVRNILKKLGLKSRVELAPRSPADPG